MFNSQLVDRLIVSGIVALNAEQNVNVILEGDVESAEYRKAVYPRYNAWMRSVFAFDLTVNQRKEVFSRVKDKAIYGIETYRAKKSAAIQSNEIKNLVRRIAQLKLDISTVEIKNRGVKVNDKVNNAVVVGLFR